MSINNFFYDWFVIAKKPVMRIITRTIDLKIPSTTKEMNKFRV